MGRPKKDEAEKKQQLNIRVLPTTKGEIEDHATRDGCTVSAKAEQLIERMLDLSDGADTETIELLADIVTEIQTVQTITGGTWHKDLKTWAAVTEIFKGSPIRKKKPSEQADDPAVQKAWSEYLNIVREKQSLITMMQKFGIEVSEQPTSRRNALLGGIFGKGIINYRKAEREQIAQIEDGAERSKAEAIFSMIEDADQQGQIAYDAWAAVTAPYIKEEIEGRTLYKDYRRKIAMDTLSKGGFPDIEDL